jgi:hypothetical protein
MSVHPRGMRNRTRLGLAALLGAGALAVACGDDAKNNNITPIPGGGSAGTPATGGAGSAGAPTTGGTSAGTFGTAGGGMETGGAGTGGTAGAGGTTAGVAGGGMAGTGGTPHVIVPSQFVVDNIRFAPKGLFGAGGDGAGGDGAGGDGAGGAPTGFAGGPGDDAAGAGGAGPVVLPPQDFFLPFDANLSPLAKNTSGFSPGVGGTGGPSIIEATTIVWDPAAGKPGGAVKLSVPFSEKYQQADFFGSFTTPNDFTGYELTASIKMTDTGDVGETCIAAWMYVYGAAGYANDKSGEPAVGVYSHLVKGEWTKIRLDLDGPYGFHSTSNFPAYTPKNMQIWGVQLNTFGCP